MPNTPTSPPTIPGRTCAMVRGKPAILLSELMDDMLWAVVHCGPNGRATVSLQNVTKKDALTWIHPTQVVPEDKSHTELFYALMTVGFMSDNPVLPNLSRAILAMDKVIEQDAFSFTAMHVRTAMGKLRRMTPAVKAREFRNVKELVKWLSGCDLVLPENMSTLLGKRRREPTPPSARA